MRARQGLGLVIGLIGGLCLLPAAHAQVQDAPAAPTASQPAQSADPLAQLMDALGDERYARREEATQALLAKGPALVPRLQARLVRETDPEIQHRLRYILEHIVPPRQAVLLIRAAPETGLQPGSIITHAGSRRVRNQAELRQRLVNAPQGSSLRVRGPSGPREVEPVQVTQLVALSNYVAPRGERLAQVVRLYATGFVEQAYQTLRQISEPIPQSELSEQLYARIAYTAGDGARALELMGDHVDVVQPSGTQEWSGPSHFDLCGPGEAPFHLEWALAARAGRDFYETDNDPDLRIQRILLPANRLADALERTAGYWQEHFRAALGSLESTNRVAGNQLAVAAWMLYGMDLRSECCRLIEPRSAILRRSSQGVHKWVRVETDAWLPFLAGDARAALDGFYEDALGILQRPPRPTDASVLIRNPQVGARIAFFLYQFPDDPRVEKTLRTVSHHAHPALTEYLDWMLYALEEGNHKAIRRDLQSVLPHLTDQRVLPYARAVALLEYVQNQPDPEVLRTARRRVLSAAAGAERDVWLAIVDALLHLTAGRPDPARRTLLPFRERAETAALWHTAGFLSNPPPSAANHAALQQPVLAVPIGPSQEHWLILSHDRRLMHFDASVSLLTALAQPAPTWFPNPLTWPWIGREEGSGRTWVYARRRVLETDLSGKRAGLRLNLRTADIPAFDRYLGPRFSLLATAAATDGEPGENSEFLRSEIKAHGEYFADPDLPEVGVIETLRLAPRVVHAALRGGPHLLIDTHTGQSWTSLWIGAQLELETAPRFFAQALPQPAGDSSPTVMLLSDQGLIRFELATERLSRVALPGPVAYPPLVSESTPYVRRDPRYVYCARLPEDGGQVFRLSVAEGGVEEMDMINEALPSRYYDMLTRAELRAALDRRLKDAQLPALEPFVAEAVETVARWTQEQHQE